MHCSDPFITLEIAMQSLALYLFHTNMMHFSGLRGKQNVEELPKTEKMLVFASADTARCRPVLETVTSPIAHSPVLCLVNSVGNPVDVKEWIRGVYIPLRMVAEGSSEIPV